MEMKMDMTPESSSASTMSGSMTNTFSTTTLVTLWFTDWTTNTPSAYAFTLIFLFVLGIFNRFLAALKTQLERRWDEVESERDGRRGGMDAREELEPLSPVSSEIRHAREKGGEGGGRRGFWFATGPWSAKRDGARAAFEFTRAVIGYILMLAVMTYNVGFFFAVTGSVLLGELVFGRYTMSTHTGWQEGGCHE